MTKSSRYKNKDSVVLENSRMRAEFLPSPGGKMASLICKNTGYEFMVQRRGTTYLDQPFDGVYVDGECSGYDDMFPTIDACNYQNAPWRQVKMADHGEVWSLPWEYRTAKNSLYMAVNGVRFNYTLEKDIYFFNETTLRLNYTLTNHATSDFEFIWAAHMMINIEEGTKLVVPEECKQVISVLSNSGRPFGEISDWPYLKDNQGKVYNGSVGRPGEVKGFEKFYFNNKLEDGWCELVYPDDKKKLKISFPALTVPYLGFLMNENGWTQPGWEHLYNIFIEPCTVCYDRPDVAKKYGQVSKIGGNEKLQWHIDISLQVKF